MPKLEKEAPSQPPKFSFRIIRGVARVDGDYYSAEKIKDGNSDVIKTNTDLLKLNSVGCIKFTSLDDVSNSLLESSSSEDDGFDQLDLSELKAVAEEGEIDLAGCGNSKAKIIAKLRDSE